MTRLARSTAIFLVFVLIVVLSPSLPVGLSYVVSDSMAPTIGVGDGVVHVPAGNVEPGEIIVFESPNREQHYTVHRVVEETQRGFVTKGDHNDITDQAAGHPHITRSELRGKVLTVGGDPLIIPHLGTLVKYRTVLLTAVASLAIIDLATASSVDRPSRPMTAGQLLGIMVAISSTVIIATIILGGTSGPAAFTVAEGGAASPTAIPAGDSVTETVSVSVTRIPLTHVAVDASSTTVTGHRWNGSTLLLSVQIPPQPPDTFYQTTLTVHRYPLTLPPSLIDDLHAVHPLVAAIATTGALVLPVYLFGLLTIHQRARIRSHATPWWRRRIDRGFK